METPRNPKPQIVSGYVPANNWQYNRTGLGFSHVPGMKNWSC